MVVGFDPNAPRGEEYSHVFLQVFDGKQWVVLDPVAGPNAREMLQRVTHAKRY